MVKMDWFGRTATLWKLVYMLVVALQCFSLASRSMLKLRGQEFKMVTILWS